MNWLPLAKLGALVALVGMTLLTFVSCEGDPEPNGSGGEERPKLSIEGHQFLLGTWTGSHDPNDPEPPEVKPLYADDHQWLQWVYWALLALAVAAFVIPRGSKMLVGVGLLGIGGVAFFIDRFNAMFARENDLRASVFDWDLGAIAAVVGFTLAILDGMAPRQPEPPKPATEAAPEPPQEPT